MPAAFRKKNVNNHNVRKNDFSPNEKKMRKTRVVQRIEKIYNRVILFFGERQWQKSR